MKYQDILFKEMGDEPETPKRCSEFLTDLNLDYIIGNIKGKKGEDYLEELFLKPLRNLQNIKYRQGVFMDLQNSDTLEIIRDFSSKMDKVTGYLSGIDRLYRYQAERWLLDSVQIYCECLISISGRLIVSEPVYEGLSSFSMYLKDYLNSESFQDLRKESQKIISDLNGIRFKMTISSGRIRVSKCHEEIDLGKEIRDLFSRFSTDQNSGSEELPRRSGGFSHVESAVLGMVAKLFPETFGEMVSFFEKNRNFIDAGIMDFYKGIKFYLFYIDFMDNFRLNGLDFCIPSLLNRNEGMILRQIYDVALAHSLLRRHGKIVPNDLTLNPGESIAVVTGPNHGGKTTFARSVGQIHYLASLGLPVPGKYVSISIPDVIFTHFEKEENIENLRGKLEDDLLRIHRILEKSSPNSLIIINEMLSSTTLKDSLMLGKRILEKIRAKGSLCLFVTFIDELAQTEGTVSLVGSVSPENPEVRTFIIERRPADGLAYAMALARKYSLTHDDIIRRVRA